MGQLCTTVNWAGVAKRYEREQKKQFVLIPTADDETLLMIVLSDASAESIDRALAELQLSSKLSAGLRLALKAGSNRATEEDA